MIDGAGKTVSRDYTLTVNPDTTPVIATESLPALTQGESKRIALQAKSVNPPFTWELSAGSLPKGMTLSRYGVLSGCPGNVGEFELTVKLTDGDSENAESVEKPFKLTVTPGGDSVRFARKFAKAPKVDGKLEGDSWKFETAVSKIVDGTPDGKAWLDFGWTDKALYVAVKVADDKLIGNRWGMKNVDEIRLYFDGKNNLEKTYNWDDIILAGNPKGDGAKQGRTFRTGMTCSEIDGGYLLEAQIPFGNLGHMISKKKKLTADWVCVGLYVMVIDIDEKNGKPKSRIVWVGSGTNDNDPSQFQTIIMKP